MTFQDKRLARVFVALAAAFLGTLRAGAQNVQHLSITQPGGMLGSNIVTGVYSVSNGVEVTWDGPAGFCQLLESTTNNHPRWHAVGRGGNLARFEVVPDRYSNSYFHVTGPAAHYAGYQICSQCHSPIVKTIKETAHFSALTNAAFVAEGGETNTECLACHTVGFGVRTGFISKARTPRLGGVQCENCHGPAANHAANPGNPVVLPRIELGGGGLRRVP